MLWLIGYAAIGVITIFISKRWYTELWDKLFVAPYPDYIKWVWVAILWPIIWLGMLKKLVKGTKEADS